MVSVNIFGQRIVLINSAKTAVEMLDKKGSIYSDRQEMYIGQELCSGGLRMLMMVGRDIDGFPLSLLTSRYSIMALDGAR